MSTILERFDGAIESSANLTVAWHTRGIILKEKLNEINIEDTKKKRGKPISFDLPLLFGNLLTAISCR